VARLETLSLVEAAARAAAGEPLVVVGGDGARVGEEVAALRSLGGRAAGFVGPAGAPLEEMAGELFPGEETVSVVHV